MNSESETPDTEGRDEVGCRWMLEFQKGDDSAFERLVLHYQGSVEHFLYRYLSDRDRTQDLTQEVFVRVFRSRRRYVPSASFKTWLFTIATRLAFNEIRGIRRRRRIFRESSDAEPGTGEPRELQADPRQISPEAKVEHDELESIVDELIEELPDKQKAALVLSRVEQLSYREIAQVLDLSLAAVKSLLMRARDSLRSRLEPYLESGRISPRAATQGEKSPMNSRSAK